ncbi:GNAT family acetyltransferase Nat4 [Aspergillus crustosus]
MPPIRRATRSARAGVRKVLGRLSSDRRTPSPKTKQKPLPLVERTNALSIEEFESLYIPSSELRFEKESRNTQPQEAGNLSTNSSTLEIDAYTVSSYSSSTISDEDIDSCLNLIELTSSAAYKASSGGWSLTEKRKEMKLPDMKYMILRREIENTVPDRVSKANESGDSEDHQEAGIFAGFLEYMVTYEDGYEVLYCYEIHLTPEVQGLGLGEELMGRFERMGQRIGLEKAMLTVFKSNGRAITFYERAGFAEDENSPRPRRLRNGTVKEVDYTIMSKKLR